MSPQSRNPSAGSRVLGVAAARPVRRRFEPVTLPPLPEQPLASVLIRNYNYAQYVGAAIQSVLDQTYGNFEVIVCDDGSTDGSQDVIQGYVAKDSRVRLVTQKNQGVARAANTAFANSRGQLILFLDSDDVFKPVKLEKILAAFRNRPRCGLYADPVQPVSKAGVPRGGRFPEKLVQGWVGPEALREGGRSVLPPMSGLSFRRQVLSLLFPIPAELNWLEDYYLGATALLLTEIASAPKSLTDYRVHDANRSGGVNAGPSSCLSAFDPGAHAKFIEGLETVLPFQKEFLRQFYGPEAAEALRLEDNPRYWDVLLGIRILRGRQAGAIRPFGEQEMIGHLSGRAEKRLWSALLLLPRPVAVRAYRFWRTPSRLKEMAKAMTLPVIKR
jgi:glycosyltransferase involved in cell wall biosynthesis